MEEDKRLFVAVGKGKSDRDSIMKWVVNKARGRRGTIICIVYVHVPAQMILLDGKEAPVRGMGETDLKEFRAKERQQVDGIFDACLRLCAEARVPSEIVYVERESVAEGILELISEYSIRELVMGAAADSRYSRKMDKPMSKKANYILDHAPAICLIWFVCKGRVIYTRPSMELYGHKIVEKKLIRGENSKPSVRLTRAEFNGFSVPQDIKGHHGSSPIHAQAKEAEKELDSATDMEINLDDLLQEIDHKSDYFQRLHTQNDKCTRKLKRKEEETAATKKLAQKNKMQCRELQMERDTAALEAQKLANSPRRKTLSPFRSEISVSDIEEATNFKIKEESTEKPKGKQVADETVYRNFIRHTEVELEMSTHSSRRTWEEEVDILSKLRHPNLATLIGVCPEKQALIYEYLPNGSLEERLSCKDNTPPLPWQTRTQIATDLCSAIHFLHSHQPESIIHGDLKPENILLDANYVSKLTNINSCPVILSSSPFIRAMSEEAFPYMDPEFLATGQLTIKSNVFSYGVILLRLLTGKRAIGIVSKVQCAWDNDDLHSILDPSAGDWPLVGAKQLTCIALRCCDMIGKKRPDLASEVWRILKPIKTPNGNFSRPLQLVHEDQIPSYFICPILKEIMHDPYFAADGFTYEANAIRGWFEGGRTTSPMTNMGLRSRKLIPNRALRSAIQEWLQRHEIA